MAIEQDFNCWLSPYGEVVKCKIAGHSHCAEKIIKEKYNLDVVDAILSDDKFSDVYDFLEWNGWWRFSNLAGRIERGEWAGLLTPTTEQKDKIFELTGKII